MTMDLAREGTDKLIPRPAPILPPVPPLRRSQAQDEGFAEAAARRQAEMEEAPTNPANANFQALTMEM